MPVPEPGRPGVSQKSPSGGASAGSVLRPYCSTKSPCGVQRADVSLVFTAGAEGSYIERLRFKAGGTNVATVARIYINNGSANTTAANNVFYGEATLPATTASATVATAEIDYMMNLAIPASFRIYVGLATAVAAGWVVTPVAGNY